ncbi:hypothetical protein ACFL6I_17555 [candidate division KSB1 bacterium]
MVRTLGTLCTLVSLLTISTACQQKPAASVPVSAQHSADYFGRKIVVRAAGASTSQQTSLAQKRLWALTEARKSCITQAAAALGEIDIEGATLLEAGRLRGQNIEISIQNYLRGIKDITEESNVLHDGSVLATVTMVIYFDGNDGLNRLLYNSLFSGEQKSFPEPGTEIIPDRRQQPITGVVIDTRNADKALLPSLTPHIYDVTGRLIYGPDHVSRNYAFRIGVAGYTKDLRNVADRIGKNPLRLDIVDVIDNDRSSVLISREAADRLLSLEKESRILSSCSVAFWVR